MDQVKRMMEAGVSLPSAIKEILANEDPPRTLAKFADDNDCNITAMSNVINGNIKPSDKYLAVLIKRFGGTPDEWRIRLYENGKPAVNV